MYKIRNRLYFRTEGQKTPLIALISKQINYAPFLHDSVPPVQNCILHDFVRYF